MTSLPTVTVRNAFSTERGTYQAIVDADGTVRVWDSVAGHYTRCHNLTPAQVAGARRRAGWRAPKLSRVEAARKNLHAAEDRLDNLRGNCDRNGPALRKAAARRVWAAVERLERAEAAAARA